jgi:hypothetical protein
LQIAVFYSAVTEWMPNLCHGPAQAGFHLTSWRDTSAVSRAWFQEVAAKMRQKGGSPPLGVHLSLGADFQSMAQNQVRNLNEQRIVLIEAIAQRL